MPLNTNNTAVTQTALHGLHKRANHFREVDASLSDALTEIIEDIQSSTFSLSRLVIGKSPALLAMQEAAVVAHERYAREAYDLCERMLDDAEESDNAECAANERDDRYQPSVSQ